MKKLYLIFITLITSNAFALINENIVGGCSIPSDFKPVFIKSTYECNSGYYLPANADGCVVCPANHYCPGGTYTFNPSESQGIVISCDTGYFAPANTDGCVVCPANHYCPGGTYTFNSLINQGIKIQCQTGYFAPANTDGCRPCPTGYTCNGGIFDINTTTAQGITPKTSMSASTQYTCSSNLTFAKNNISNLRPVFVPNTVSLTWDDDNGHTTETTCTYGEIIALPPAPTRAGYTFNGWTVKTE